MSVGGARHTLVSDEGYLRFVRALARMVRRDAGDMPRPFAEVARLEADRLDGEARSAATLLAPSVTGRAGADEPSGSAPEPSPVRAAALGLGTLASSWPRHSFGAMDGLLADAEAVIRLWGVSPCDESCPETTRTRLALQDRQAEAVRYVSAAMFEVARAARIPGDDVDRAAAEFASVLGERLFGDPRAVFAAPRGPIVAAEHELQQSGGASGRIRCLAFGIREVADGAAPGAIRCKAIVGPDAGSEAQP